MVFVRGYIFLVYKQCMRVMGVWPLDSHTYYSAIVFWTTASLQIAHLITLLINPLGKCPSYEFGNTAFRQIEWRIFTLTLQICYYLSSSSKTPLIKSMIHDWSSVTDPREREIMIRHDKSGYLFFAFASVIHVAEMVRQFTEMPYIRGVNSANIRAMCAFTDGSSWATVNATLGFLLSVRAYIIAISTKAILWNLYMHLSAQYTILKTRYYDLQLIEGHKERRRVFRKLVQRHNELFDQSKDLELSFNDISTIIIFFAQYYACTFSVSSISYIKALRFDIGGTHLSMLVLQLFSLHVSYYACDYLTTCCEDVSEVFTQCNWYDLSKEEIINYSIVISRCQRPTQFTFMKIYEMNLSNFKHVLEALYSYMSVMASVTKNPG